MRALIVGHGYVGSRAASLWQTEGAVVSVTTTTPSKIPDLEELYPHVHLLRYPSEDLRRALQGQDVILVAVAPHPGASYEETYLSTAHALASQVKGSHVIYLSSISVYGDCGGTPVTEETPLAPLTRQAEILRETEEVILRIPGACILRLGEIIGPGRTTADKLKRMEGKAFPGTGENFANLSPIELILKAIDAAQRKRLSGIYNVCSSEHPTRRELYLKCAAEHALPPPQWDPEKKSLHGGNKKVISSKMANVCKT